MEFISFFALLTFSLQNTYRKNLGEIYRGSDRDL